jgi:LysM repeat protein
MSSIRPLVTITILVVACAFLYVQINKGSLQPKPEASEAWNDQPEGLPPLATASVAPVTTDSAAPTWGTNATPPTATTASEVPQTEPTVTTATPAEVSTATPDAAAPSSPAIPAMPEMPDLSSTASAEIGAAPQVTAPPTPAVTLPTDLPTNIPEARYPDQAPIDATGGQPPAPISAMPPATVTPDPLQTATPEVSAPTAPTQATATTPEEMNAAAAASAGVSSQPLTESPNPLRQTDPTTPDAGRYGTDVTAAPASSAPSTAAATPVETSFTAAWPTIQAMLDRGELAEAHQQLSRWYGDPSLTPTDAERVDTLLSQLAGTVVYSTEHRLAPAHVVKQGENLEAIASQYNIPWQLLAKINGVAAPNQVQPGQELKVVRGPFAAVVDLGRNQLTLTVDGRYAGKFPVTVTPGMSISDGEWTVDRKTNAQSPGRAMLLRGSAPTPGAPGTPTLIIASDTLPTTPADGMVIKVAAKDAEELSDILSVGSRVVTRR